MTAENTSGFTPFDTRVVIFPDPVETKIGSIIMPDQVVEKDKWAQTKATVIAVGANAFLDWGDSAPKPKAGDRVIAGKYVGATHIGADGKNYTVCTDTDILAAWSGD